MIDSANPFLGWADDDVEQVFSEWPIGTLTRKAGGYDWPGRVCGYLVMSNGSVSLGVENRLSPKTAHIFPPHQVVKEDRTDKQILADVAARML